jgi:O-antigen ligase
MPPPLAAFLTIGFIVWLFRRDFREQHNVTRALWIPFFWLFLIASRPATHWMAALGLHGSGAGAVEEGSSLDAIVYTSLIVSGAYVLSRRNVNLGQVIEDNKWLVFFILYCFIAIAWSEFPIISLKRWVKVIGHPIMVLIVFTEPDMKESFATMMKRCAYVVFPVSILWMKYYPELGKQPNEWGVSNNCGIAEGKNELGSLGLIFGLFVVWYGLQLLRSDKSEYRKRELQLTAGLAWLIAYCLHKAHSGTSVIAFLICVALMIALGLRFVNKRMIGLYIVAAIAVLGVAQLTFDIYGNVVEASGHGLTMEGRARLWQYLLQNDDSPIFGTGFESFWLGSRSQKIWEEFRWQPTQAHNGYVEIYINLGIVGLMILLGLILITFRKCRRDLLTDFQWGRLTICYLIAIVLHNWTEAGFKGLSLYLLTLFLVAIKYPYNEAASASLVNEPYDEKADLVYSGREAWEAGGTGWR